MRTVSPALSRRAAGARDAGGAAGRGSGPGTWRAAGALVAAADGDAAETAAVPASTRAISEPFDTLSPRLSNTSAIVPAAVAGTSIEALSVSSVTSGESMAMTAPAFTSTSTTDTSVELPISGLVRRTRVPAPPRTGPEGPRTPG